MCTNGFWLSILTAQPLTFSAFTHSRMTLLLSPKFLSHPLCQAIFPSWSELSPEQKFPKSLPLLAERWNYQPSRARQMNQMPCVRLKEAPSSGCLHTALWVRKSRPPAVFYHHTCSPASTRGWICSSTVKAASQWLTSFSSLTLVLDSWP